MARPPQRRPFVVKFKSPCIRPPDPPHPCAAREGLWTNHANGSRAGRILRNLALYFVAFTFITAWLPLVRSIMDGASYQWGADYFSHRLGGSGLAGDFWFLIAQGAAALAMLYLGFRRPGVLSYALLIGWLALNFANVAHAYFYEDGGIIFHGDTLGVVFNVTIVGMVLYGGGLLAALAAAFLEHANGKRPPRFAWSNANTIVLSVAIILAPLQYTLLADASGQDQADQIGVILIMVQWALLVIAFAIARRRSLQPPQRLRYAADLFAVHAVRAGTARHNSRCIRIQPGDEPWTTPQMCPAPTRRWLIQRDA